MSFICINRNGQHREALWNQSLLTAPQLPVLERVAGEIAKTAPSQIAGKTCH